MQGTRAVLLLTVLVIAGTASSQSLGDRLLRTFLVFKNIDLLQADAQRHNFLPYDYYGNGRPTSCSNTTGIVLTSSGTPPGRTDQTMYVYNIDGRLSGFGIRAWDLTPGPLLSKFWQRSPTVNNGYDIFVIFRPNLCLPGGGGTFALGDRIAVWGQFPLPLNASSAAQQKYIRGNCISKMGSHFWLDLKTPGTMQWDSNTMMPVLPMYLDDGPNVGRLQTILIASPKFQWTEPIGMYEGPFTNGLFCKNACAKDQPACSKFTNAGIWTTMHWAFYDPAAATCNNSPCKF